MASTFIHDLISDFKMLHLKLYLEVTVHLLKCFILTQLDLLRGQGFLRNIFTTRAFVNVNIHFK